MPKRLYVDTNILVYLLERHEHYSSEVAAQLEKFTKSPESVLITSALTITEFLAGTKSSSADSLRKVPRLKFSSLDEALAEQAGNLKRMSGLKIADAIHLATAMSLKADALFTNDKQLAAIASKHLKVVHL